MLTTGMFATWCQGSPDALQALVTQAQAAYNLGNDQHDQGLLAEAEASFRQALALVPEFAEAHSNLALLLQQQGRLPQARRVWARVALRVGAAGGAEDQAGAADRVLRRPAADVGSPPCAARSRPCRGSESRSGRRRV